jgi:hypothetical protein
VSLQYYYRGIRRRQCRVPTILFEELGDGTAVSLQYYYRGIRRRQCRVPTILFEELGDGSAVSLQYYYRISRHNKMALVRACLLGRSPI